MTGKDASDFVAGLDDVSFECQLRIQSDTKDFQGVGGWNDDVVHRDDEFASSPSSAFARHEADLLLGWV